MGLRENVFVATKEQVPIMGNVFALAHAVKGTSFVCTLDEGGAPVVTRLTEDVAAPAKAGKSKKPKLTFLSKIKPGDILLTELGGPADRICLAAMGCGAEVWRFPAFRLNKEETSRIVQAAHWPVPIEKPRGEETSDELTARKTRAMAMQKLWESKVGFLKSDEQDASLMLLRVSYRSFRRSQKSVLRAYQGLLAAYRDQIFLELGYYRQQAAKLTEDDIHSAVLEKLLTDMLGEMNDEDRQSYFAAIGKEFEGGVLPARATEDDITKIVEIIMESDAVRATSLKRLNEQKRHIEKLLKGGSVKCLTGKGEKIVLTANAIFEKVFDPIEGCGPLIAARIITAIGDIRRFESTAKLKAFAGYHHFEDGSRFRRGRGKPAKCNMDLKQAVYLLCDQTLKRKSSPWRARLDLRRAYELYKILKDRQLKAFDENLDIEILPTAFEKRTIASVNDMKVDDLAVLAAHVDTLRDLAGVKNVREASEDADESEEDDEAKSTVKDPKLAKLVRGVKQMALDKGMRWLGQKFLEHFFREWRKAIGLPEYSFRLQPLATASTEPPPKATTSNGSTTPVQWANI